MSRTEDKRFLGKGWGFPPAFHRDDNSIQTHMVSEEDDVRESLRILLSTRPGERIMQPAYGCPIQSMQFDVINESVITELRDAIERAVLFFEPRIVLHFVDVDVSRSLDGIISLQLNYTVLSTNTRSNIVYPYYFLEGSHVRV